MGMDVNPDNDWFSNHTGYDILALRKLYDQGVGTPVMEEEIPELETQLCKGYPNPFNPEVTIEYNLSSNIQNPQIEIFNLKGQLVRSYNLEDAEGQNSITWNGRDSNDNSVSSGVYFYSLKNNGQVLETRKITLLK
jgi:hypothetical protein